MASYYAGAGDGIIEYYHASWDTVHDGQSGTYSNYTIDTETIRVTRTSSSTFYLIRRAFFPIDTSGIDDGATITASTFSVYKTSNEWNGDNDGDDWLNIVQTTQSSNTSLSDGDFDQCGTIDNPTEGATRIDISSLSGSDGWVTWTMNATGIGWISKTGWTKLGIREGHDCIDSPYAGAAATSNGMEIYFSETDSSLVVLDVTVQTTTIADYIDENNWVACRVYQRAS